MGVHPSLLSSCSQSHPLTCCQTPAFPSAAPTPNTAPESRLLLGLPVLLPRLPFYPPPHARYSACVPGLPSVCQGEAHLFPGVLLLLLLYLPNSREVPCSPKLCVLNQRGKLLKKARWQIFEDLWATHILLLLFFFWCLCWRLNPGPPAC